MRGFARPGFTLTELLVVVAIIVVITIAVLPTVFGSLEDRKYSEAARSIQAALAGARDRAVLEKRIVGVRLIRDETDPLEVSRLIYVGVPEPYSVGTVHNSSGSAAALRTIDSDVNPNPYWNQVDATGTPRVAPQVGGIAQSYIRFNHTGALFGIDSVDLLSGTTLTLLSTDPQTPPYYPDPRGPDNQPGMAGVDDDGNGTIDDTTELGAAGSDDLPLTRYQIFTPPAPLAQLDPVLLPAGMVTDVRLPDPMTMTARSLAIPGQSGGNMDILFGPNGHIVGLAANSPLIHFWLGARADKNGSRDRKLVTLNTRTGAVVVYPNPAVTGTPPNYPEIYGPAEQALGVSILDVP